MPIVVGARRLEEFLRWAAAISPDKSDLERVAEEIGRKLDDLLLAGFSNASSQGKNVVNVADLPITKGLQERTIAVRSYEEPLDMEAIGFVARRIAERPGFGDDVLAMLPDLAGALLLACAQLLRVIYPDVVNPTAEQWDMTFRAMDVLV